MKKKKMHMAIPTKNFIFLHPFSKKQNAACSFYAIDNPNSPDEKPKIGK